MGADTITEEDVLRSLDFDHKETCEVKVCDMAATFVLLCRHCTGSSMVCTTHYLQIRSVFNRLGCVCKRCFKSGSTLDELCRVIPIGDRS